MKTKFFLSAFLAVAISAFSQDHTTVTANSSDISDNLDLKAVASIFGDSENLEDFERRLNDPKMQISNLDLNNDNQVDYLRVIESVEGNTHLIILQAVMDRDLYQDVATIEIERDRYNNVQAQVVGDTYMYGANYIYEPVYVSTPVIYSSFWTVGYRPYYSSWYWGYYPTYYYAWEPYPIFRYRRNVNVYVNVHNHYNYVNTRRSRVAATLYSGRRSDAYARRYPERTFERRHTGVINRYELDQHRTVRDLSVRNTGGLPRNTQSINTPRPNNGARSNNTTRENTTNTPRPSQQVGARAEQPGRSQVGARSDNTPRPQRTEVNSGSPSSEDVRSNTPTRNEVNTPRPTNTPRQSDPAVRNNGPASVQNITPRQQAAQRDNGTRRAVTRAERSASPVQQSRVNSGGRQGAARNSAGARGTRR